VRRASVLTLTVLAKKDSRPGDLAVVKNPHRRQGLRRDGHLAPQTEHGFSTHESSDAIRLKEALDEMRLGRIMRHVHLLHL